MTAEAEGGRPMGKAEIRTDRGRSPAAAIRRAFSAGGFVFTAGQVGIDPATGELAGDTIEAQTAQVLDNLRPFWPRPERHSPTW